MGGLEPKYLLKAFAVTFDNKNKKRVNYLTTRLVEGSVSKHPFLVGCPKDEGLLRLKCKEIYYLHATSKVWPSDVDWLVSFTQ